MIVELTQWEEEEFEKWWNSDDSQGSELWHDARYKKLAKMCWVNGYRRGYDEGHYFAYNHG